jgi:Uncharacterised nucleotidyltransferase
MSYHLTKNQQMETPIAPLAPLDQLLLACLHQDPHRQVAIRDASLSTDQWYAFLQSAIRHNVSPLLFHRLRTRNALHYLPETIQNRFRERYFENAARNISFFFQLKDVLKAMQIADIPVIALKGSYLAHTVYPNISVREMSDIDIMVPLEKLAEADGIFKWLGYIPEIPSEIDFEIKHFAYLPTYHKPASPEIELHWAITDPNSHRYFNVKELWWNTEHFQIEGIDVQGLSRELLLVHVCAHISHHHGFNTSLRSYCDIAEILDRYAVNLDWRLIEDVAERLGVKRGVFLSLLLAKELLGAKVALETLKTFEPSNMGERVIKTALHQCFSGERLKDLQPVAAQILQRKGLWFKAKGMVQRLFLPRKMIARMYGLAPNSWYTWLYYPVRLLDLIRRHTKTIRDYARGDEHTTSVVQNVAFLEGWLGGE